MTNRIRLTLAAIAALVVTLLPAVALAQPDFADLATTWGQWPLFVGVAVSLAIELGKKLWPQIADRLSPIARRVVPLVVAGLGAGAAALLVGADWAAAGLAVLSAWGTALATGDTLRVLLDLVWKRQAVTTEGTVTVTVAVTEPPANAKPLNPPLSEDDLPPAA